MTRREHVALIAAIVAPPIMAIVLVVLAIDIARYRQAGSRRTARACRAPRSPAQDSGRSQDFSSETRARARYP